MSQITGSYVSPMLLFSFTYFIVAAIGFTDVINGVIKKMFTRLCPQTKDNETIEKAVCGEDNNDFDFQNKLKCNIQTVTNEDFISTWL